MNIKETKKSIIQAGKIAVDELIKVAREAIVDSGDDITADRLKNAAATQQLAMFDAVEILTSTQAEDILLDSKCPEENNSVFFQLVAEARPNQCSTRHYDKDLRL